MIQEKQALPGIDRIQTRFLDMLKDRQADIATHALGAWESDTVEAINESLTEARNILRQIAGTAGSTSFDDLGATARDCASKINTHLTGPDADLALCPGELVLYMDQFVQSCGALIEQHPQLVRV